MTRSGQDENQDVMKPIISVEPVISSDELAQLRKANNDLENRNYELREKVRQLRLQSAAAESERDQYKREAKKIKGELEQYRTPPLVIGTIEALASEERVIVRSTTGPQFVSKIGENVKPEDLIPGRQCALHPQSFVVVEVLPSKYDAFISGMEVEIAPNVRYTDVGGLDKQKVLLREAIELPLLKPQLFEKVGIEPPKGVLLVGPPGTGKTLLAKAVSRETNAAFIQVVGSELVQKYIGEGARLVRELFALAREKAPAIIFIDEIDAIGSSRSNDSYSAGDHEVNRTLMQLLSELDGFKTQGNVKIIAATNRMDILDQALLRPGRFDRIIEFPLPDEDGRKMILVIHTRKMHLDKTVSLEKIAKETPDMNGSELMAICVEAGMNAVRGNRTKVRDEDFILAIEAVKQGRKPKNMPLTDGMYS
ncbi:MAG TPA: proteasome-activating nucleotidase [Methanocorpusculum sp.]|nr:proteasome-activating nucleotidase [Methanocorpusculum sp.]HJJ51394.1 proteasome-activating nucleotidase [Methanocorpusculum sp.]HJJ54047.1 proteasome-activating nucleotidase [Methanocorpusculum sp.]HKL98242.1 proteasome-activating nucleotidase [Methanocorpusculum sp.]